MMSGRAVLSRLLLHISGHSLILASAAGVAASLGLLVAAPSLPVAGVAIALLGFSLAAIYPTCLGLAAARYASHSGTVFGLLIGFSLTGGMSLPWLIGRESASHGITAGLDHSNCGRGCDLRLATARRPNDEEFAEETKSCAIVSRLCSHCFFSERCPCPRSRAPFLPSGPTPRIWN